MLGLNILVKFILLKNNYIYFFKFKPNKFKKEFSSVM